MDVSEARPRSGETFGQFIRRMRTKNQALTMSKLIKSVPIYMSVAYLSEIERDQKPPPSDDKLEVLASGLGVDPDVLVESASFQRGILLKTGNATNAQRALAREVSDSLSKIDDDTAAEIICMIRSRYT